MTIGATRLNSIVNDVIDSLKSQGIRGLVIVNAHGGNYVLSNAVLVDVGKLQTEFSRPTHMTR